MLIRAVVLGVAAALAAPAATPAQSLAEIAEQSKEKRKDKKAGKLYTEEDLREARRRSGAVPDDGLPPETPEPAAAAEGGQAAPEPAEKEKTPEEIRAEQEKAWRDRLQKANEEVVELTQEVDRLQTTVNGMGGNLYSARRTELLGRLEATKQKLEAARQAVSGLEDEGRRNRYR